MMYIIKLNLHQFSMNMKCSWCQELNDVNLDSFLQYTEDSALCFTFGGMGSPSSHQFRLLQNFVNINF